jgi:hypothetical protein
MAVYSYVVEGWLYNKLHLRRKYMWNKWQDLYVVQEQQFWNNIIYVRNVHLTKCQAYIVFIREKSMLSERMLHKDYYRKGSVGEKKILVVGLKGLDAKTSWLAVNRQS